MLMVMTNESKWKSCIGVARKRQRQQKEQNKKNVCTRTNVKH